MSGRQTAAAERQDVGQVPTQGTALAPIEPPTDDQIAQIRRRGAIAVAQRQEISKIEKQLAGLEWGTGTAVVRGSDLSPMTRAVFAEFCAITRANPMYHVDVLGGRPYLNANYWSDRINAEPLFVRFEQRDLSPSVEQALRERAKAHRDVAEQLAASTSDEAARRRAKALDLEEEADDIALARAQWSAPAWATVVIQTTIYRFIDATPIDAIRRGEITDFERWIVPVPECNWAGGKTTGKNDPVGNAEPAKTARTRSLRRAAVRAFSAWMQQYEQQIRRAEEALEAEWEEIREERTETRAALPRSGEAQAVRTGNGEPSAARVIDAEPLPVEDATADEIAPIRQQVIDGCNDRDLSLVGLADEVLGHEPETLADWQKLLRVVQSHVAQMDEAWRKQDRHLYAEGDEQGRLV